jgi:hypothetical protein
MPKNPDLTLDSPTALTLRNAQLEDALIVLKETAPGSPELRKAKDDLRSFRQFWREVNEWVAVCNASGVNPADGVAYPDAIEATAKG